MRQDGDQHKGLYVVVCGESAQMIERWDSGAKGMDVQQAWMCTSLPPLFSFDVSLSRTHCSWWCPSFPPLSR